MDGVWTRRRSQPHRRWLWPVVEAEEERGLGAGFGAGNQFRCLGIIQRCEFARELNVLFELWNGVAADDDGADGA